MRACEESVNNKKKGTSPKTKRRREGGVAKPQPGALEAFAAEMGDAQSSQVLGENSRCSAAHCCAFVLCHGCSVFRRYTWFCQNPLRVSLGSSPRTGDNSERRTRKRCRRRVYFAAYKSSLRREGQTNALNFRPPKKQTEHHETKVLFCSASGVESNLT